MLAILALAQFALPLDTLSLKQAGASAGVPAQVMYAVKWKESRVTRAENARGPGREQCDSLGCRRVCREIGPGQINPCIRWAWPECEPGHLREYYHNLACMASILKHLHDKHGNWPEAIRRYNGSGPRSREYQREALAYIGWLTLLRQ